MRRLLSVLLLLVVLLALPSCPVFAEESVGTGDSLVFFDAPEASGYAGKAASVSYSMDTASVTGNCVTFSITSAPQGSVLYSLAYVPDWTTAYQALLNVNAASLTYTLYMPGKYRLFARNSSGAVLGYSSVITVTGEDLLSKKVLELTASCTATDDYGKALWAHDWLTLNTYYDSTLAWHGPDVLLFKGYGVCQSYSEAYRKLVMALGLSCEIVQSTAMGHEWVVVQVNGSWYHVDATWDTLATAPAGQGKPAATNDHVYFLLADELLSYNHRSYQTERLCTTMKDNHYIHTGDADRWLPTAEAMALTQLEQSETAFVISLPNIKSIDSRVDVKAADVAELLNGTTLRGEKTMYILTAEHVPSSYRYMSPEIRITAKAVPITGDNTPVLLWACLAMAAAAVLYVLLRQRHA